VSAPPPLVRLTGAERRRFERLERLGRLLDTAVGVPGTRFRFGLDPLLGLVPGLGDALGAALSGYIVLEAARLGASRGVLGRMLFNIGVDTLLGAVPGLGDLFDFAWKSDSMNVALLRRHLERPEATRAASRRFLAAMLLALLLLAAGAVIGAVALLRWMAARSGIF
jgi:hypothetical protein